MAFGVGRGGLVAADGVEGEVAEELAGDASGAPTSKFRDEPDIGFRRGEGDADVVQAAVLLEIPHARATHLVSGRPRPLR